MERIYWAMTIALVLIILSAPVWAITPPSDKDALWLRGAPDLQKRIDFCESKLEPLLNPTANPAGVVQAFGKGIDRSFGLTPDDTGYSNRYDKNADKVIDERDFIEMAFDQSLVMRQANNSPKEGEAHCAVLLIKFPDQAPDPAHDAAYWQSMFFSDDFYTTRSYYIQCSAQKLYITGDVLTNPDDPDGWFMAAHERSYYVDEGDLLGEILDYADPYYDFSQYDADSNSESDGVYFVYAGNDTGWGSFYWGWASYGDYIVDGVRVGPLMFCGEFLMTYRVAAHEFGHMMGLPDLYDYTFTSWGVGNWSLMGKGEVYMDPWSRMKLGWADVMELAIDRYGEKIYPQSQNSKVYKLWTEGKSGNEYFMVSYGKKEGYDANLPGEGLLIWHVDENGTNNEWWHKKVDVEEADGNDDLDDSTNMGDETDPYYDPNNTTFNHDSYPNSDNYAGEPSEVEVLNISAIGDYMTADLKVGVPGEVEVEETEPNNLWDDSGVIDTIPPNGVFDGRVDYYDDPSDFWRCLAPAIGVLKADLICYNQNINLSLFLWSQDGSEVIASAQTTQPSEHLEAYVPTAGYYYLQVKPEGKGAYYDIRASLQTLPAGGKIDAYGYDMMPPTVYGNTQTIPALRVNLLNGGGAQTTLNELRVFATGSAHYSAQSAKLWLDDGDTLFGPGRDQLLAGPAAFDPNTAAAIFPGLDYDLGPGTNLLVTVDLSEAPQDYTSVGLRMFAYKDITVDGALVEYHNFPLSSTQAAMLNPPMPLCYVAAGDFIMGSDPDNDPYYDPACDYNEETPVHTNHTGNYYIGKYEITNAQYAEFMAAGGYDNPSYWTTAGWNWKTDKNITAPNGWNEGEYPIGDAYPDYPVAGVSQYEAYAFANWFGGRLPHEAEWEKSGRGTDARLYTYGNTYDSSKYWYSFPPVEVGGYPQSDSMYGVADLEGNVFEWMDDGWMWGMYEMYKSGNLTPPSGGSYAMQRGYSWLIVGDCEADYATRLPYRDTWPRNTRWTFVGFRVVFDAP